MKPLSSSMPFTARAALMVARGEARDYSQACSLLARRRRRPAIRPSVERVPPVRLPYADN